MSDVHVGSILRWKFVGTVSLATGYVSRADHALPWLIISEIPNIGFRVQHVTSGNIVVKSHAFVERHFDVVGCS